MALTKVSIVSMPVADQDRAKEFYVGVLGFSVLSDTDMTPEDFPPDSGLRWLQVAPPDGGPSLVLETWSDRLKPGTQSLTLGCDDIQATRDDLLARGVTPDGPIRQAPWGDFFSITDPDGNALLIVQERAWSA